MEQIDAEEKVKQEQERKLIENEVKELKSVGSKAGDIAKEIEDLIYRFKPDCNPPQAH